MKIDAKVIEKINKVINCFETGKPESSYGVLTILPDGPGKSRQITYGKQQTTEYGNLEELIEMYICMDGKFAADFKKYADVIGHKPLVDDTNFINLLKSASNDPIMWKCQDEFFENLYWDPMVKWAEKNGFTLNLSALVLYDSFIHSGGILWKIRNAFPESTPANGGDEKKWISQYVEARRNWLANHSNPVLHTTVYRMKTMQLILDAEDWGLLLPIKANGNIIK